MDKICLIGFMGSGKTTIGKSLSQRLQKPWVDLDAYIVQQAQKPISDIFKTEGESAFRQLESDCLSQVLQGPYSVIATGGGVITTPENIKKLQQVPTIYLSHDFDTLYDRIKGDTARPLVTSYEALHNRFLQRQPLYEAAATVKLECGGKSINTIVEEIISKLEEK